MHMKKKYKNIIIYFSLFLVTIIAITLSNRIIATVLPNNIITSTIDIHELRRYPVDFRIPDILIQNDIFGSVRIDGWAFVDTELANDNNEIYLIFVDNSNDENVYIHKIEDLVFRADANQHMHDRPGIERKVGFFTFFSTVGMTNGVYDLFIYCRENDTDFGITSTFIQFEKSNRGFRRHLFSSSVETPSGQFVDTDISANLSEDHFLETFTHLTVDGVWAFIPGVDSRLSNLFLVFADKEGNQVTVNSASIPRVDVVDHFGNWLYLYSGVQCQIPIDILPYNIISVQVLIEHEGKIFSSQIVYLDLLKTSDYP